jgi:hypothetical protein
MGSETSGDGGSSDAGMLPFNADSPSTYVAKVKNLLVGLPPTAAELQRVESDTAPPSALAALVDTWMGAADPTAMCAPSTTATCSALYQTKMLRFFELAFQQTQVQFGDFQNQLSGWFWYAPVVNQNPTLAQNLEEMFPRTMLQLTNPSTGSPQPFNNAMTTQSYMMTTATKVLIAFADAWQLGDGVEAYVDNFATSMAASHPGLKMQVTTKPIPLSETVDPASPNFMIWSDPTFKPVPAPEAGACDPLVYAPGASTLGSILEGSYPKDLNGCAANTGQAFLVPGDFTDWTLVTVTQPSGAQATTGFYDLPTLRGASQMVLNRPYVGYFTTPAFFANWQTNDSNQMRVTTNQTLIVATGMAINPNDPTTPNPNPPPGLDQTHATQAACIQCHQHLDPTRSIFTATFSWYYGVQENSPPTPTTLPDGGNGPDIDWKDQNGLFTFEGVNQAPTSIYNFAQILSTHPQLAPGWVQKLCYYFDSQACVSGGADSVFNGIVSQFQKGYSWNSLVKAVLVSPLTTYASTTVTATTNGETVAVERRDHLCAALNARLGFIDACELSTNPRVRTELPSNALSIVPGLPSDGYGRGSPIPVLPNSPTLFYRAGTENLCEAVAQIVIDPRTPPAGVTTWKSSECVVGDGNCPSDGGASSCQPIVDFVTLIAGIPTNDARFCPLYQTLLQDFVDNQAEAGADKTNALQSTFTAACMAPSAISIGL